MILNFWIPVETYGASFCDFSKKKKKKTHVERRENPFLDVARCRRGLTRSRTDLIAKDTLNRPYREQTPFRSLGSFYQRARPFSQATRTSRPGTRTRSNQQDCFARSNFHSRPTSALRNLFLSVSLSFSLHRRFEYFSPRPIRRKIRSYLSLLERWITFEYSPRGWFTRNVYSMERLLG